MAHSGNQFPARLRNGGKRDVPAKRTLDPWVLRACWVVTGVLVFFGSIWFFWENKLRDAYPIEYVRIESPLLNLNEEEFTRAIAPLVRSGLFDVDLGAIEAVARTFAWVDSVRVIRQWPNTLIVRVREHRPIARWNEDSLLSDRGARFTPPSLEGFSDLPRLYGNEGQQNLVLDVWRKLNELLRERKWRVTMLSSNSRQSWTARLSDGKELMVGRQDPVAGVTRLLTLLPELGQRQVAAIRKVDLRYRNGFAVIWRFEPETEPEPLKQDAPKPQALKRVPGLRRASPQLAANQW